MSDKIGVINEVGDLGLGFDPLTESESQQLKDKEKKDEKTRNSSN